MLLWYMSDTEKQKRGFRGSHLARWARNIDYAGYLARAQIRNLSSLSDLDRELKIGDLSYL